MKVDRLLNQVPAMVLRSPLHRALSGSTLLLTFTGRRSGRRYTTPVAYLEQGDEVWVTTDSPWYRNLADHPEVDLVVRGERRQLRAETVVDREAVADALVTIVRARPRYGKWAHIEIRDGEPDRDQARAEAERGRVLVKLRER